MQSALRNRIAPAVPLKLELEEDGGKRILNLKLSWNFRASAEVEELNGLNLLTGEAWTKLSARNLGIMFWASLLAHQPELGGRLDGETFEEYQKIQRERKAEGLEIVESWIDLGNADSVNEAVWNAYFLSLPKDKREALENARKTLMDGTRKEARPLAEPQNPSDGSNSGPSPDTTSASVSTSSESLPTPNSTLSSTAILSASATTGSVQEPSLLLSPTVLHSATPIGSL